MLDGAYLTAIRTGAVDGSAIRHLAKKDVTSLAIISAEYKDYIIRGVERQPLSD